MCIFWGEKFNLPSFFSKIWKLNNPCEIIKAKLSQKGAIFVYSIPTVIKRSNWMTVFFRLVIHFEDQTFKFMIWSIPNPPFWCHSKISSKETQICISNTICVNKVIIKVKPKHVILFFQLMKNWGVKQGSLFDVIFPNSSVQFQSSISQPNNNRKF